MTANLTNPIFQEELKAREWLEDNRWPDGPVCPHCGADKGQVKRLEGKASRPGLWQCNGCHGQFSVTVGTLYERSHIPLHKWLLATHLMTSSKKGISAHQLHRMLGITYKSAWFMAHRIREAMKDTSPTPMGSGGGTVEADETYLGGRKKGLNASGRQHGMADKMKVVGLVERGGKARTFRVDAVNNKTIHSILLQNVDRGSALMTDEANHYVGIGKQFASHGHVEHNAKQYVNGNAHTNTIEGYFSIFKRGMKGVYQHCGEQHLHRYLAEFDFRYNNRDAVGVNDAMRAEKALKGIAGKRLTYRRIGARREGAPN